MPYRSFLTAVLVVFSLLGAACSDDAGVVRPEPDARVPDAQAPDADPPGGHDGGAASREVSAPPVEAGPRLFGAGPPFTIVNLPDTQFYTLSYPATFDAQVRWIVAEREKRNIAFVLHSGDIVETPQAAGEWQRANASMAMLDGLIPYALAAGNHDIVLPGRESPLLNATFPMSRFNPHLKGTFEANKIDNAYYLYPASGREWLVVSLEFGPRDEVVAWAEAVFKMHPDRPAILLTHAYMYLGEQRYDYARFRATQYWNPHAYEINGSKNDGEEMWQKIVSRNDNVLMVLSGHMTGYGGATGRISTRRANGAWVHEMLANYQGCPVVQCVDPATMEHEMGGKGYLRIIRIEPANKRALVETYSPTLDKSKVDTANQFELPLE